jgi:pectate lyase
VKNSLLLSVACVSFLALGAASLEARNYSWGSYAGKPVSWFRSGEAVRIADNILSYQTPHGGWPKNTDMAKGPYRGDAGRLRGTFDNGATHGHMRFMARAYEATGEERFKGAFLRGLDYMLRAQYPTGGWPQFFPLRGGYSDHITFNDGAMIGIMKMLKEVGAEPSFSFVGPERRERVRQAYRRGIQCILRCQIVVGGEPTVWCAQHDARTLEPRPARSYEKASLSGGESAGIVLFLMDIETPDAAVRRAVAGACRWYEKSKVTGIRVVRKGGDKVVVPDPEAPPLWARFYDIRTNEPIFCGRDGVVKKRLAAIERERRTGYSWYVRSGASVLDRWPRWRKRVQALGQRLHDTSGRVHVAGARGRWSGLPASRAGAGERRFQ